MTHDLATRCFRLRIETQLGYHVLHYLHMILRLFEILFPLFFQFLVLHTLQRCRVNLNAAEFISNP